jgi:hypothetical protein
MWRDVGELAADVALVTATNEYASWLAEHKQLEPDWTWLEVALGTALCLLHSTALGKLRGGDWKRQQWRVVRSFSIGAVPVVLGEVRQYRQRREERRRYNRQRQ